MSQQIDEMLACVSQIMHQIEQGNISETEIELIVSLFASLTKPETRALTLRSFTRTFETIPPPPIIVESEKNPGGSEETKAISVEPLPATPHIGVKPKVSTTYNMVGPRTSRDLRDTGLRPTRLDDETTKDRCSIDLSAIRGRRD